MEKVISRMIIDNTNYIDFSADGIETYCGDIAHQIRFGIARKYRQSTTLPKAYFECIALQQIAEKMNFEIK